MSSSGGDGFPRSRRIRRSVEFRELNRGGRRRTNPAFVILCGQGPTPTGRLGVTVSRRVGNAVVRNRVKRRIRDWFRREPGVLGLDLVVIARPAAADLERGATAPLLRQLLERQR